MSTLRARAVVLLGSGYDAYLAVASIKQLREAGYAVLIVGQTIGFIRDMNGISVCSEKSLSEVTPGSEEKLLLLPGGKAYLSALLTDPRVHNLFDSIIRNQGLIVISSEAQQLLVEIAGERPLLQAVALFQKSEEINTIAPEHTNLLV